MRRAFLHTFSILVVVLILFSCDKVEKPYTEKDQEPWNGRKILLFDFTGHTCVNCPEAHEEIHRLQETFGEAIVPVAVHCTSFAVASAEPFTYDFTNEISTELGPDKEDNPGYFNVAGLPEGAVNTMVPEKVSAPSEWASLVSPFISDFPEFDINVDNSISDSTLTSEIEVNAKIAASRNIKLCAYITESKIIKPQVVKDGVNKDYEHNNVLRGSLNGTFGEFLNPDDASINEGETFSKTYSLKLDNILNFQNCSLVSFVYDDDTKDVLQVEETDLTE